jgi:NAD(P)-dependent dehydrogenase (short-subunit alcohol dehydrogenase family)
MQPQRFDGKVALVTGSSRGFGRALAERLGAEGATVLVNSWHTAVDGRNVAQGINERGGKAFFVRASMEREEDIAALGALVAERFGRLDVIVHNAAGGCECLAADTSWADFERTFRVNSFALIALARHLGPVLGERSKLVYISSFGSTRAVPGYAVVGASKAASEALVRSLAMELAPKTQVNCVRPSILPTVSLRAFSLADEFLAMTEEEAPSGLGQLEDGVGAVLFLASGDADYITGQCLDVDGGLSTSIHRARWDTRQLARRATADLHRPSRAQSG